MYVRCLLSMYENMSFDILPYGLLRVVKNYSLSWTIIATPPPKKFLCALLPDPNSTDRRVPGGPLSTATFHLPFRPSRGLPVAAGSRTPGSAGSLPFKSPGGRVSPSPSEDSAPPTDGPDTVSGPERRARRRKGVRSERNGMADNTLYMRAHNRTSRRTIGIPDG